MSAIVIAIILSKSSANARQKINKEMQLTKENSGKWWIQQKLRLGHNLPFDTLSPISVSCSCPGPTHNVAPKLQIGFLAPSILPFISHLYPHGFHSCRTLLGASDDDDSFIHSFIKIWFKALMNAGKWMLSFGDITFAFLKMKIVLLPGRVAKT